MCLPSERGDNAALNGQCACASFSTLIVVLIVWCLERRREHIMSICLFSVRHTHCAPAYVMYANNILHQWRSRVSIISGVLVCLVSIEFSGLSYVWRFRVYLICGVHMCFHIQQRSRVSITFRVSQC